MDTYTSREAPWRTNFRRKRTFKQHPGLHRIKIKSYHANNGTFWANAWVRNCAKQRQILTFAAANAHFENGVAEGHIRALQDLVQTMMTNAISRWMQAIPSVLWPYVIRHTQLNLDHTPLEKLRSRTPFQAFAGLQTIR